MSLAWRNMAAMLTLGLSMTTQQVMAQSGNVANSNLETYVQQLQKDKPADLDHRLRNVELVRKALASLPAEQRAQASVAAFGVPAISSLKRMPDVIPTDGVAGRMIPAVAAKGEFAPLSFVVAPLTNIDKLEVRATNLTSNGKRIDAAQVDVKVIKVWYQTGTAWHSYFADVTHRVLVPELLLNDENLIRVDHATQDNYLRVDYPEGAKFVWISAPPDIDDGKFNHVVEPVSDNKKLQPVALKAGESKQFWVTIHVPADATAGVYQGNIELLVDGKVITQLPLSLRVLPFELPLPRTYYDLSTPFYSMIYNSVFLQAHLDMSGGNVELAEAKLRSELKNLREHNVFNHLLRGRREMSDRYAEQTLHELQMIKDAGFVPPLFNAFSASGSLFFPKYRNPGRFEKYLSDARRTMDMVKKILGHENVYMFGFDEPGMAMLLAQQDGWEELHRIGAKIYSTSKDAHYPAVGFAENAPNYSGTFTRERALKWNLLGQNILSYAGPHTGPENPEFNRRAHGMELYKALYGGTGNYKYYDQHKIWNDFSSNGFRGFNMVYPTQTGVIDTMAWEGFRVGLDDVRYATLLKQLAAEAIATDKVDAIYAAKKALIWLEESDAKNGDLEAIRLEMINYILELRQHLGKGDA